MENLSYIYEFVCIWMKKTAVRCTVLWIIYNSDVSFWIVFDSKGKFTWKENLLNYKKITLKRLVELRLKSGLDVNRKSIRWEFAWTGDNSRIGWRHSVNVDTKEETINLLRVIMEATNVKKSPDQNQKQPPHQRHFNKWSLLAVADCRTGPHRSLSGEISSLPNMPYMSMSMPLTRSTSAISSLQDIREIRSNLPRQLKYSFWQR